MPPKIKRDDSASDVPWRSRFPVARIKKIMQADEDVGKVAQVVPVIISKALELFMASMIDEAARHTFETGHKRVIPGHLKMAVKGNPMFDFLEPNVEKIADPIQIESKSVDEKKVRKPRTKRVNENENNQTYSNEEVSREEHPEHSAQGKRVKLEQGEQQQVPDRPKHRSMSIANLISQSSPEAAA